MEMGEWKEHAIIRFLMAVSRIGLVILGIAVMAILLVGTVLRFFGVSWAGYAEVLIMAVGWLYMFGTARACYKDSHTKSDVVNVVIKSGMVRDTIQLIRWILMVLIGIVMCWWGIQLCMWSVAQGNITGVYGLPAVIGYASMIFGLGTGSICYVFCLIEYAGYYIRTYVKKEVEA